MTDAPKLKIYNTLTRKKEDFVPIDASDVRIYVCGPTVYDFAHIGNARPVIVFDVLNRLLRHLYGEDHVTYVRNITDVDDKINARALRDYPDLPLNEAIRNVTEKTTRQFHKDVAALGCLEPDFEPRATEHIDGMVKMIEVLIDKGNAYQAGGEVLFDVSSMADYGQLSNRKLEDQQAGARIATTSHKKNPGDFVLWKQSSENEPGWSSPWGVGRPGWHLECSVMSEHHLGKVFDIHGGGLDLIFPHHENEIAQSRCAHGNDKMANYWMHNGYLQVEGKKMSKSDGNFVTIQDLLETNFFANQKWHGRVLRLAMLMTHYRQPIDWTADRLVTARSTLYDWNMRVFEAPLGPVPEQIVSKLSDDLNTVGVISELHNLFNKIPLAGSGADIVKASGEFRAALELLGLYEFGPSVELLKQTVVDGSEQEIGEKIDERLAHIANKDWAAADTIRDELLAQGIQLKDGKDPETGERTTTWEVKR